MAAAQETVDRRVSIVLPTFNRAAFLPDALEMCLSQTHADIELIVVDDGSTDATGEIVRRRDDDRIVYLRHEHNQGLPEALNTGFPRATGAYLTWVCDDDRLAPTAIEEMLVFLEANPDVDFTYADYWFMDAQGHVDREVDVKPPAMLAYGNCVGPCRLYRRAVYESIGDYDPAARLAEDYDYWLRVASRFRMVPLRRRLYSFRRHGQSLGGRHGFEVWRVAERVKLARGWTTPAGHRRAIEVIDMREALAHGGRAHGLGRAFKAITRDPRHLRNREVLSLVLEALIGTSARQRLRTLKQRTAPSL